MTPGAEGGAAEVGPAIRPVGSGRVDKPWGYELRWAVNDRYLGKLLHIERGHSLSLQYHVEKDETIFVSRGELELVLEDETGSLRTHRLSPGMSAWVPPGRRHRFVAVEEVDLFEVSSPEMEDVVRLEDNYGRAPSSAQ